MMRRRKESKLPGIMAAALTGLAVLVIWKVIPRRTPLDPPTPVLAERFPKYLPKPERVKGIYLSSATAGSPERLEALLDLADRTELNAMVIDIKDDDSEPSFVWQSSIGVGTEGAVTIPKIAKMLRTVHARGVYAIARVSVFQDNYLAERRPDLALKRSDGRLWRDRKGIGWLDPAARDVWTYNLELARAAHSMGFDEIQFDYIRFPSDGSLRTIVYPFWKKEEVKTSVIGGFFAYLDSELRQKGIPISVDLFGLTMRRGDDDLGIGQRLAEALPYVDFISPMVYPSHYSSGYIGLEDPAANPREVIRAAMAAGNSIRNELPDPKAAFRPWLQDFDLGAEYTPEMVRAQIEEAEAGGAEGWLLWNARNVYTEEALKSD